MSGKSIEASKGYTPLKIKHDTMEKGKPVTIVREGHRETVVERHDEDPEHLRPESSKDRVSYRGRWGSRD